MTIEVWYGLVLVAAAVAAVPLVLGAERIGRARGIVDVPRGGELQARPVPRTGGYGLFLAFWIAMLLSFMVVPEGLERLPADNRRLLGLFLGSALLLPVALWDDLRRLGPWPQLAGQVLVAMVPALFGLRIEELATPFGVIPLPDALAGPLAVLWVVGMMNAINLLDTLDGLAAGIAAIGAGVLFLRSAWFDQASIAILPAALAGACCGFLTRNWHPSRVILGSCGSLFLGYVLGGVTVIGGAKIGTAVLVMAVPILDVAWVAYRRLAQGRSPLRGGDAEHLPHRLRQLGLAPSAIAWTLYMVSGAVGLAILLTHGALPTMEKLYFALAVLAVVAIGLVIVTRLGSATRREPQRPAGHADP